MNKIKIAHNLKAKEDYEKDVQLDESVLPGSRPKCRSRPVDQAFISTVTKYFTRIMILIVK